MEEIEYKNAYPKWVRVTGNITMMVMLFISMIALHHSDHKLMQKQIYCAEHHVPDSVLSSYKMIIDSLTHENDSLRNIVSNPSKRVASVRDKEAQARKELMQFVKWLVTDDTHNQRVEIHHYNH